MDTLCKPCYTGDCSIFFDRFIKKLIYTVVLFGESCCNQFIQEGELMDLFYLLNRKRGDQFG